MFKEINEAYRVLLDPEKRAEFDHLDSLRGLSPDPSAKNSGPGTMDADYPGEVPAWWNFVPPEDRNPKKPDPSRLGPRLQRFFYFLDLLIDIRILLAGVLTIIVSYILYGFFHQHILTLPNTSR